MALCGSRYFPRLSLLSKINGSSSALYFKELALLQDETAQRAARVHFHGPDTFVIIPCLLLEFYTLAVHGCVAFFPSSERIANSPAVEGIDATPKTDLVACLNLCASSAMTAVDLLD